MTIISERLQHLRLTHGYTQTELARTMGVSRRAVYAWEHNKCHIQIVFNISFLLN